jgi:rod shape-determining protein MreD
MFRVLAIMLMRIDMARSDETGQLLLQQVLFFVGLLFIAFVESALGQIPSFHGASPKLMFCLLFVINIYCPKVIGLLPMMVVGLIFDLTQGNPLGYSSSLYLIILTYTQLRHSFLIEAEAINVWAEFVVMIFGIMICMMVIFGLYTSAWPPFSEMIFQIGLTILLLPVVRWIFDLYRNLSLYLEGRQ